MKYVFSGISPTRLRRAQYTTALPGNRPDYGISAKIVAVSNPHIPQQGMV
jgi:hypothetical protein